VSLANPVTNVPWLFAPEVGMSVPRVGPPLLPVLSPAGVYGNRTPWLSFPRRINPIRDIDRQEQRPPPSSERGGRLLTSLPPPQRTLPRARDWLILFFPNLPFMTVSEEAGIHPTAAVSPHTLIFPSGARSQ